MRTLSVLLILAFIIIPRPVAAQDLPMSGTAVASMAGLDRAIIQLMLKWRIPGGAVAVAKDGRLVFARGYGYADVEANQVVQPNNLFRIGSISKGITAAAILKLVEERRLDLDARAFALLDHLKPTAGSSPDPRIGDITVRQLLHHSAGWDQEVTFDPIIMPWPARAALELRLEPPARCETLIRFMLGRPLDYAPGTGFVYSNLGYCVLGRIIEKVSGQPYEAYVKTVLAPAGIKRMQVGRTRAQDRLPGEVRYYDYPGAGRAPSVFSASESEPRPYGGAFYLEGIDAPAGWIASPVDLLRFVLGLEGQHGSKLFRVSDTFDMMVARPTPPLGAISFVGVGIRLEPRNGLPGIAEVLENGPAAQAGLRAGDIIIAVNGQPTQGKTVNEVADMLPGPEGSSIDLTVSRGNQVLTARVVRRRIVVPHEYYAMGWKVRIDAGRMTWWHEGGLPGTAAFVVRAPEGWALAAVFNSRPRDVYGFVVAEMPSVLQQAAGEVREWPAHDLFGQYP